MTTAETWSETQLPAIDPAWDPLKEARGEARAKRLAGELAPVVRRAGQWRLGKPCECRGGDLLEQQRGALLGARTRRKVATHRWCRACKTFQRLPRKRGRR